MYVDPLSGVDAAVIKSASPSFMIVKDKEFELFIPDASIQQTVQKMAQAINQDYASLHPLVLPVLNGAFMFASDLMKAVTIPVELSFIKLKSYQGTKSTGNIENLIGLQDEIAGRHVIIVEDIVDTGKTLRFTLDTLSARNPASVAIATLLHKSEMTKVPLDLRYVGFDIPNRFVVGYGLDYDGYGRNLKDIYQLKN